MPENQRSEDQAPNGPRHRAEQDPEQLHKGETVYPRHRAEDNKEN